VDVCTRCGAFVCVECVTSVAANALCGPCAARVPAIPSDKLPAPVIRTLVLSAGGLLFPPLGLVGAATAAWLLRRKARKHLTPRAEDSLRNAIRIGLNGALVSAIVWFFWAVLR
jgi:hypothetical protein